MFTLQVSAIISLTCSKIRAPSAAIPFLYSSSLNAYTNDGFPSTVGSAGHLCFVSLLASFLSPLTSRWCATWLELTRHGGFG